MKLPVFQWRKKFFRFIHTIQAKIFIAYGSIFLLLIPVVSLMYYSTSYQNFLESQSHTSRQLSKILSTQIQQYLDSLNNIQKRILESEEMLSYIFEGAPQRNVLLDRGFRENIYGITGYDLNFYHINIYNMEDETLITFGQNYDYIDYTVSPDVQRSLIDPALEKNGAIYLAPLESRPLYCPVEGTSTLSLVRTFGRYSLSRPKAVIEIQVSFSKIQELISDTVLSYGNEAEQVFIFDKEQRLIYPETYPREQLAYYAGLNTDSGFLFKNPVTGRAELISSYQSSGFGLTTLLLTPEEYLTTNRHFFQMVALSICGISFLLLMALTYKIAKNISTPLAALKNRISALELETLADEPSPSLPVESEFFSEVEMLNESYNRMEKRLRRSLEDIVASRTLAMHSQLMSLQAQMDSHFLYNTLTIISIIAEENDDMAASAMCLKLTEMLRYITEDYSRETSFLKELHHCQNYTDLMSIRFGRKISFQYEITDSLLSVQVPRLIMQPIVENCVKYSRKEGSVLNVSIRAVIEDGWWRLIIGDNGDGFTKESLEQIYQRIERLNQAKEYHTLSIDGLGLANIYLRLKLYYNDHFLFDLANDSVTNGAVITIGGPYNEP